MQLSELSKYELTNVSEERLPDVIRNFKLDGALCTEVEASEDGTFVIRATYQNAPRPGSFGAGKYGIGLYGGKSATKTG